MPVRKNAGKPHPRKYLLTTLAAVLSLLAAYALFGFFGLPLILRSVLPGKLSAAADRRVDIETVEVNPFVLTIKFEGITVADKDGAAFASADAFFVDLEIASLFKRALIVRDVRLVKPFVDIVRRSDGTLNVLESSGAETSVAPDDTQTQPPAVLDFAIEKLHLQGGRIVYTDQTGKTPFKTFIEPLDVAVEQLSSQPEKPAAYTITARTAENETLNARGTFSLFPYGSEGEIVLRRISLAKYAPFFSGNMPLRIAGGKIDFKTGYRFAPENRPPVMMLTRADARLEALEVKSSRNTEKLLVIPDLSVENTDVDIVAKKLAIANLTSQNGAVWCNRLADGSLNLTAPAPSASEKEPPPKHPAPDGPSWEVDLNRLVLKDYAIRFEDLSLARPAKINMDQVRLEVEGLTTRPGESFSVLLALRSGQKGSISTKGTVTPDPLSADLEVQAEGIDIRSFQPYFADKANLVVTGGDFHAAGRFYFSRKPDLAPVLRYTGEASIARFSSVDRKLKQDFLKWKSLYFTGVDFGYAPLKIFVDQVSLADFYSRMIINPDGTLNLRTVFSTEGPDKAMPAASVSGRAAEPRPAPLPDIRINTATFQGGRVHFSDRLIGKNFETELLELGGRISGLSSDEQSRADVFLKGRHAGAAPLEIQGKINPLAATRHADLKLTFRGIELSPFSPYSGKYLGYILDKGRLTVELGYKLLDNRIQGENRIFLDQLTLGDKVDSPEATSLPVKLGIALLKDANGRIELDFPVNGDLSDPQFNLGKAVFKIIGNLFVKIISSPFAALGSMFAADVQLSHVDFELGSSRVDAAAEKTLNNLAAALTDRPGLKLEIRGAADPENDRPALRKARFDDLLAAKKREDMAQEGTDPGSLAAVTVAPPEFETYVKKAYDASSIPKPREKSGRIKALSAQEMEKLLFTAIEVTDEDLRALARDRAAAVKDYLLDSQKFDRQRIFILEPETSSGPDSGRNHSRVNFSLK